MKLRSLLVFLIIFAALSIGLNAIQYRNHANSVERTLHNSVKDRLLRLSINRTLLVDTANPPSLESRKLLHSSINIDLLKIQPKIDELGKAYQERYQGILTDLDDYLRSNPDEFNLENLIMDLPMRSRYIDIISTGYNPE